MRFDYLYMTTIKRKPRIYKKGKKIYIKIKGKFV